jgi:Zn ribbon nucleic-acid-binding protein
MKEEITEEIEVVLKRNQEKLDSLSKEIEEMMLVREQLKFQVAEDEMTILRKQFGTKIACPTCYAQGDNSMGTNIADLETIPCARCGGTGYLWAIRFDEQTTKDVFVRLFGVGVCDPNL